MRSPSLITIASLLLAVPVGIGLPTPYAKHPIPAVVAQTTQNRKAEADRLLEQATSLIDKQQGQAAIQLLQQALTIYQALKDRQGEGNALKGLGNAYYFLKDYEKDVVYQQQALAISHEIKDRDLEAKVLNNLGLAYKALKSPTKAIDYFQQALTISRTISSKNLEKLVLGNLASIYYFDLHNPAKTLEFAQPLLALLRELKDRSAEGWLLAYMGDAYATLSNYQKAIEVAQQALVIAREIKNSQIEIIALHSLTRSSGFLENSQKTIEFGQQELTIAQQINNKFFKGWALAYMGDAYVNLGDYQKAIEVAQQALVIAREIKNSQIEVIALHSLTRSSNFLENSQKTIEFGQQELTIAQQINNKFFEGWALGFLGEAYKVLGNAQKALELAQQSLKIAQEIKQRNLELVSLATIADAYDFLGDEKKAIEIAQQVLVAAQEPKNRRFTALSLSTLGRAYQSIGDYQKAIEFLEKELAIEQEVKNRSGEAITLINLGNVYDSLENYAKAVELYQQSVDIGRKIKHARIEAQALGRLSDVYSSLGEYKKAIESGEQGLAIAQAIKNPQALINSLNQLWTIYETLGSYQKLIEISQQGVTAAQEIQNHLIESIFLSYLSAAYFYEENYSKTVEIAQQSLTIADKEKNQYAKSVALLVLSLGYGGLEDYGKATQVAQQSLAIARQNKISWEGTILNVLGELYRKAEKPEQAITAFRQALATTDSQNEEDADRVNAETGLAKVYQELNMPITAIFYYKQGIKGIEGIRSKLRNLSPELQASFLQSTIDFDRRKTADNYRGLADLLLAQGRILEAQQVLELLKVQEIKDFTKERSVRGEKPDVASTQTEVKIRSKNDSVIAFGRQVSECERVNCKEKSQLNDRLTALTQEFDQDLQTIEQQIRDRRAKDDAFFDPRSLGNAERIVEQPGTVLIYPFVLENKLWLLLASEGGVVKKFEAKVGQKELGETVVKFRQLLQNPQSNLAELQATSAQLYDWLIAPLEPELKANSIKNLVFSLDRVTRYIPMSALFDVKSKKYLIENYTVDTILSADLTDTRDRLPNETQNTSMLAMGVSEAKGFPPLPNVKAELDAIVQTSKGNTGGIYPGQAFLNQAFDFRTLRDNLAGHKILHIATHGKFVPGSSDKSYLVTGKGEELTIKEIKALTKLSDIHLVVLSACETALGETGQDGVEIAGIAYYFLNRGAKAVMASLWSVSDSSTSKLMQQFYKNLATGTTTKAEALRQAQLSLLAGTTEAAKTERLPRRGIVAEPLPRARTITPFNSSSDFSHPYYWAPFTLIGNGL